MGTLGQIIEETEGTPGQMIEGTQGTQGQVIERYVKKQKRTQMGEEKMKLCMKLISWN